jgi:hypothetical protein
MKHKLLHTTIILAAAVLSGCNDVPAAGRYEFREDKNGHLIRLNTRTGEASIVDGEGSHQLLPPEDTSKSAQLRPEELSKLTGNAGCLQNQQFEGRLYNGTEVVVRTVGVIITNKKLLSDEVAWKRQFVVRDLYIRPLEVKAFVIPLTGVESSQCEWTIGYAYGSAWRPDASWWDRPTN